MRTWFLLILLSATAPALAWGWSQGVQEVLDYQREMVIDESLQEEVELGTEVVSVPSSSRELTTWLFEQLNGEVNDRGRTEGIQILNVKASHRNLSEQKAAIQALLEPGFYCRALQEVYERESREDFDFDLKALCGQYVEGLADRALKSSAQVWAAQVKSDDYGDQVRTFLFVIDKDSNQAIKMSFVILGEL